jgi:hypothetical protein
LKGVARFIPMPKLDKNTREFIELCLSKRVEFVIVGGYALAAHGAPRFTEDIDLLIAVSPENATRLFEALDAFGFGNIGITREDFLEEKSVVQLGRPPNRIDILTAIEGVTWGEVWDTKTPLDIDGLQCWAIGFEEIVRNKRASGRPQDLADVARLERTHSKRPKS